MHSDAMSSRANGIATGRSADLPTAACVTQVGEVLRSEPDWHIAQDDILWELGYLGIHHVSHRALNKCQLSGRCLQSAVDGSRFLTGYLRHR